MDENQKKFYENAPDQKSDSENVALDDERRVKVLSPGMLVFKRFVRNHLAIVGASIIVFMFLFSFLGGVVIPYGESQVFKGYQPLLKDYAAVTENQEYRYVVKEGASFDSSAKAKMILAMQKGESSFQNAGQTYGLTQEGENFYRITAMQTVASGKGIKNQFTLQPAEGVTLPADFTDRFNAAVTAKQTSFTTSDGTTYFVQTTKVQATVSVENDLALASMMIFNGELKDDYGFRLAAERTMQSKQDADFSYNDASYHMAYADGTASFLLNGEEVASASHLVIKEITSGTVFPEGFAIGVQNALSEAQTSFTLTNAEGEEFEYQIERKNLQYTIRRMEPTYQLLTFQSPSWEHWLGTDGNGMDILTRLMYGGRISLMIGFIVVIVETILGVILGGISGYFGKWVDNLIMRIVDIFNCIPGWPIYIILGSIMDAQKVPSEQRIFYLMIVLGILGWPGIARIVRGQILSLREQEFMTATEATGLSVNRRIFRHLVPNVIPQLIVIDTMSLGGIILTEATLSFLGLGVKYPLASWGSIISAVNNVYVMTNYWFAWIPAGMLILLTVLGFNFIGDGLRDAFDPKMKR